VIADLGFSAYVLLVADICRFARVAGIRCGPRGSAAGSLVCHGVGISEPDPLEHGLIFERFLNKDRIEMPDIDLDFQDDRRGEVFDYLVATYGADRVACVATYGTLGPKAAIRDVGRVLGYDPRTTDALCRAVGDARDFAEAADGAEFKRLLASDPALERLVTEAQPLAGTIRHSSTHAAATVIAAVPLEKLAPLMRASGSERPQVQYPGDELQHAGLLKMDVLGLDNLTVLDRALRLIEERHGVAIDVWGLPTDDALTYGLLAQGRVHGVFQLGTSSGRRLTLEVKPNSLADLMALVALNRPGPLEFASQYAAVKNGSAPLVSPHPAITELVRETQGVVIFQEQVIRIAREFAGFTYGEADVLRKAIGKKIADLLAKQKDKFVAGAVQSSGVSREEAEGVWSYFEPFARYGFSRSHACAYAFLTYQTAYLKAHYPLEFMCAVLDVARDRPDKVALGVAECLALGIEVLGPDVAHSDVSFTIEGASIRFGLAAVKGVGEEMARNLVAATPYARFFEVATKPAALPTKAALESLVKVGAFPFVTRAAQLEVLDRLVARGSTYRREVDSPQLSLFGPLDGFPEPNPAIPEVSGDTLLSWERELCGVYVSDNPLKRAASTRGVTLTSDVVVGASVKLVGEVRRARELRSRRTNATFLGADLVDIAGELPLVCFPRVYGRLVADSPGILKDGALYELTGRIEEYNGELQLVLEDAAPWVDAPIRPQPLPEPAPPVVRLTIPAESDPTLWLKVWSIASGRPGPVPLELVLQRGDARVRRRLLVGVSACAEIVELLANRGSTPGV
ncbi:MAG TPA: DNA polymerase III subunit alpha, partial [Anaeromyxobacteraceae bacterium]|nr:DNA polymerase III subunit alpha [Anaeromyxobacteraceae bacterium]